MKLKSHASSDRAFVWTTLADFADEEPKQELFAIRFRDSDGQLSLLFAFRHSHIFKVISVAIIKLYHIRDILCNVTCFWSEGSSYIS